MRRVALLIKTSRAYGHNLLRGVQRCAQEHGPWSLFVEVRDLETRPPVWLRNWDGEGILKVVPILRSTFERSCHQLLGRSPHEEINRAHIDHVCRFVRDSDLSLEQITAHTGLAMSQYILEVFRKTTGVTPGNQEREYVPAVATVSLAGSVALQASVFPTTAC